MASIQQGSLARDLEGIHTEVVLQTYSDRVMVLITQLGKVGNLIQATIPATTPLPPVPNPNSLPLPPAAIELTPLLGSASSQHIQTLHSLYAAQVATFVWTMESQGLIDVFRRGVVVGIALQVSTDEQETKIFRGVMEMLRELLPQPIQPVE